MMKAVTATTSGELVISVCMQHLTSGRHAKPQVIGLLSLTTLLFVSDRIDLCTIYDLFTDKPEVKARMGVPRAAATSTPWWKPW